jgi:hypothetical protein
MKYIYVLSCSEKDTYYEQFLLSLASLFLYNKNTKVVVLTDKDSNDFLNKQSFNRNIKFDIRVIDTPSGFSQKEKSRFVKTSMRKYITGDFLFIDCDTIITDKIDAQFPEEIVIASVLDTHVLLSQHHLCNEFKKRDAILNYKRETHSDKYFNSGIIYSKDIPESHQFFDKWHNLWIESNKRGILADQPSFNQANYELDNIITELPGEWNCQISHNGLPYLHNSKIIHYYATSLVSFVPAYKLASPEILDSIKSTGEIPKEAMTMLENPKSAFNAHSRIVADPVVIGAFDSSIFSKIIWLNKTHPGFFNRCDYFMSICTRIVKKIIGKK